MLGQEIEERFVAIDERVRQIALVLQGGSLKVQISRDIVNEIIQSCTEFYNLLDSAIQVLKVSVPEVHKEMQELIKVELVGVEPKQLFKADIRYGSMTIPRACDLPSGLSNVLDLLQEAVEQDAVGSTRERDELFWTARLTFMKLRGCLTRFLTRLNYVLMYPHRLIADRALLEPILRRHGMDRALGYLQSAETHFNDQKYAEFAAMARNTLEEAIKQISLLTGGQDRGWAENIKTLESTGFLRSVVGRLVKELHGSLSAVGSHPAHEPLTNNEAKYLHDQLFGAMGFLALNLASQHQVQKSSKQANPSGTDDAGILWSSLPVGCRKTAWISCAVHAVNGHMALWAPVISLQDSASD